jgi:hypothetical protein
MKAIGFAALAGLALALVGVAPAQGKEPEPSDAGAPFVPACIQVATSSRWVPYGYNHIVALTNGCSQAATCSVSTDVNPTVQSVTVPKGATVEVMTFLGANSSTFIARVDCRLR